MLFLHKKKKAISTKQSDSLQYTIANLQGVGKRRHQEDSFGFGNVIISEKKQKDGLLAVVADGMGGMKDGRTASKITVDILLKSCGKILSADDIPTALCGNMVSAGHEVYEKTKGAGGTTVVSCVFTDSKLYFASVGDSSLFLVRNNMIFRMNREQNMRNKILMEDIDRNSLDLQLRNEPDNPLALAQYLGMQTITDIDHLRKPFSLQKQDVIVIFSDGVSGVLSENLLLKCIGSNAPKKICKNIDREIKKINLKHQDNYTALVIRCV